MPFKERADRIAYRASVRAAERDGQPDRRHGRGPGMVVQGTRVDLLPARPRWEAIARKPTWTALYVCACGFTATCSGSWTFERVPHTCAV